MAQTVTVKGQDYQFPDDMPREDIRAALTKRFQAQSPESQPGASGVSQQDVAGMLASEQGGIAQPTPAVAADPRSNLTEYVGNQFKEAGRQVGLGGRAGLEGVGQTLDFVGTPLRLAIDYISGKRSEGGGKLLADTLGLPEPQGGTERIVPAIRAGSPPSPRPARPESSSISRPS